MLFRSELGHHVLHKHFIEKATFKDRDEWKKFILNDIRREPLETQANMFAAFLLLPTNSLAEEYRKAKSELSKHPSFNNNELPDDQTLCPYLAKPISKKLDRKSTRLNSSHTDISRMPSSA